MLIIIQREGRQATTRLKVYSREENNFGLSLIGDRKKMRSLAINNKLS